MVGRGSVTIFDGSHMVTNAHLAKERRPILASGVVLHVLPAGSEFDLTTRELVRSEPEIDPAEADELALANRDLRKMARDIAAGDVSPSTCAAASPDGPEEQRSDRQRNDDEDAHGLGTGAGRARTSPSSRRGSTGARTSGPTRRRSTSSSTSGVLEEFPTNTIPGFTDHLLEALPGLREHSCSRGRRGGFVERLQRGHLARPRRRARRAGAAAGRRPRHPARQDAAGQGRQKGRYNVDLRLRRRAGRAGGRPARRTPGQPPGRGRPRVRLRGGARRLHPARAAHRVRPVDAGDHRRGRLARHPVDPAQPGLARAARPGRPRQAHPRHDDLGDQLDRGRHRLRQGPDHAAARRGRPAGAQAGVGAYGGPGGHRRQPDRLPGRRQAARRQPRPRGVPRTCRTRTRSARPSRSRRSSRVVAGSWSSRSSPARTTAA